MSWMLSLLMIILFVVVVGIILSMPAVYQNPVLYVLPIVIFVAFLASLGIK
jgi:hypothetical protein